MEKRALGRGLDALLPTTKPAPMPELPEVQHLSVDAIEPRETYRVSKTMRTNRPAAIPVAIGARMLNTPAATATPLPP